MTRIFRAVAFILICLFPAYLLRFKIGPLPSTVLEIVFLIFASVWFFKYSRTDLKNIKKFFADHRWFGVSFLLFFTASVISIFVSDMWYYSFGQWRAYFLEPMILFLIFIGRREFFDKKFFITALSFSTISIATFAIFQKLSGWTLPADGRATSFFTSPNSVGLYLGPILFLAILRLNKIKMGWHKWVHIFIIAISVVAIYFTKSLGTVAAICGGLTLFLFLTNRKRQAVAFLVALILAMTIATPLRGFVTSKDQSSNNRLLLWQYSTEFLSASPKNFIFGAGVRQFFRKVQKPHYDVKELERLIYPHNIFLNFWTETGLLGMISFLLLYGSLICFGTQIYRHDILTGACILSALTVFFLHGLIDVPYFKNDLAMLFWTLAAVIVNQHTPNPSLEGNRKIPSSEEGEGGVL